MQITLFIESNNSQFFSLVFLFFFFSIIYLDPCFPLKHNLCRDDTNIIVLQTVN